MGLPEYSNLTVGISITAEAEDGEGIDHDALLDLVNQKLGQAVDFDPSWIQSKEFKHIGHLHPESDRRNDYVIAACCAFITF